MNSKNTLQEYYQKLKCTLPEYTTVRIGGSDDQPFWQSSVKTRDGTYYGVISTTKKQAEISAADVALLTFPKTKKPKVYLQGRVGLFVDVENLPLFTDEVSERYENIDIYAFVGEHHALSNKIFTPNVIKVVSPSTRRDGTDTCIQVYIGWLLSQNRYDTYLIATSDHFGSSLVEMIKDTKSPWVSREAKVVTNISHL